MLLTQPQVPATQLEPTPRQSFDALAPRYVHLSVFCLVIRDTVVASAAVLLRPSHIKPGLIPSISVFGYRSNKSLNIIRQADSCMSRHSAPNDDECIKSFFNSFHRNFPVVHESSFHVVSAQVPLLNVMKAVGSLYCQSTYDDARRKSTLEKTLVSLQRYVRSKFGITQ